MELREQTEFIKILERNGFFAYKVKASKPGVPDIEGVKNKVCHHFEAKRIDGVLSNKQKFHLKNTYENPHIVMKINGKFHIWGDWFETNVLETKIIFIGSIKDYLKE